MKHTIIDNYFNGMLLGDIMKNFSEKKLEINRIENSSKHQLYLGKYLKFLHSTVGKIDNKLIGGADTFLIEDSKGWNRYKDIRMNILLNKYGYYTFNYSYDKENCSLKRNILSRMPFGTIIIREWVFTNNLNV